MSDINFLANKKNNSKKPSGENEKRKIEWTKPNKDEVSFVKVSADKSSLVETSKSKPPLAKISEDKIVSSGGRTDKHGKFKFFGLLSFFKSKKNDNDNKLLAEQKRFKRSRGKILEAIDNREKNKPAAPRKNDNETKKAHGFLWWKKKIAPVEKISEKSAEKTGKEELNTKNNGNNSTPDLAKKITRKENKKIWEKAGILETNLIKGELASFFNWKKGILILAIYSVLSGLIVAGFYGGLLLWEQEIKKSGSESSSRIRDLNEQVIKPLEEDAKKILAEQEKIKLAGDLLRKHIYWTNFFKFLEDNTLSEVYYTSNFSGDTKGKYTLPARAKNFKIILDQVTVMRISDNVEKAAVSGGSVSLPKQEKQGSQEEGGDKNAAGVNFKLELSVNPDVFLR